MRVSLDIGSRMFFYAAIDENFKQNNIRRYSSNCLLIAGSGTLPVIMLLVMIIENNKIDAYFRSG